MELINRELSWLSFNERVLQESMDATVPLVERVRFLGIYSNNMDEFFRVRVANLKRMITMKENQLDGFHGTPSDLLEEIREVVLKQQKQFEQSYKEIIAELAKNQIFQLNESNLSDAQRHEITSFFHNDLKHSIVQLILKEGAPFPKLQDNSIYLAVTLKTLNKGKIYYSLIEIPTNYNRIYKLKSEGNHSFILIDDIIRMNLESIYSIFTFESLDAFTFKLTRDAELNLDDDISVSFVEKIEKSLKLRKKGEPVRFVYDQRMPSELKAYLLKSLNLKEGANAIPGGKYHNFKDFSRFPDFGNKSLIYEPMPALDHPVLRHVKSLLKAILAQDILLHFPYQRFDYVVDFLREAAIDPKVKSIKINIYRVARDSQVMNALLNAANNGKEVTVVMELQARFDEANNMYWSERLKEEGVKVIFGSQGSKVHSKLIYVTRESGGKEQFIAFIGTGNFNENTAKFYTDLGLFTAHEAICQEVAKVFKVLENKTQRDNYKYLLVSPFNNRKKIVDLIDQEIANAQKGIKAGIYLKINNLVDNKLISKLYEASRAGVQLKLLVRGVCCLVPGEKKFSENIEVISIVDRYLEHSRFMIFENNQQPLYFITSADWMERNLDKRIEVAVPIIDQSIQEELQFIFDSYWSDNTKARKIDQKMKNKYRKKSDHDLDVEAQRMVYRYYQQKLI